MPSTRYIELPSRYPRDAEGWTKIYADIQKALARSVQQVDRETKRSGATHGRDSVYVGTCGIAFMQYHLASLTFASHKPTSSSSPISPVSPTSPTSSPSCRAQSSPLLPETLRLKADQHLTSILHQDRLPQTVKDASHLSFLETPIGIAALTLSRCLESLSHPRYSENESALAYLRKWWKASVQLLASGVQRIQTEDSYTGENGHENGHVWMDEDGCEVLYGRAGFLYALLFLRRAMEKAKALKSYERELEDGWREEVEVLTRNETLCVIVESIVKRGKLGAMYYAREVNASGAGDRALPPLMWKWHGKRYLGGAHGAVGILQTLLSCPKSIIQNHSVDILSTIEWVVHLQDHEGNWPSSAPVADSRSNYDLIQWCHGAPATLMLLSTLLRVASQVESPFQLSQNQRAHFTSSLKLGANLTYQHGLLRKGVGICHGVSGSIYALLSASSILDVPGKSETYFKRAVHLAHLATFVEELERKGLMKVPDRPMSLYEGLGGCCCAWAEVLERLREGRRRTGSSGMPGYDDFLV